MREVSVEELTGEEILALPIEINDRVLIHADTVLKDEYINRLMSYKIRKVFVKDHVELDNHEDSALEILSLDASYEQSKKIVEKILKKHIYKHNEELKKLGEEAEKILDMVLSEPQILEGITEIRRISTDIYSHCINVCSLSTIMALKLKMNERQVKSVAIGAILHDIGLKYIQVPYCNVQLSDLKPSECLEYKKHTIYGYSSLQEEKWIPDTAKEIILFHHERIDGKGFPFQQRAEKLKSEVRLVTLCDEFDSLISGIGNRKIKIYEAIEYIKVHSGTLFDPNITLKFLENIALYPVGIEVITNEGEVGVVVRQNRDVTDRPVIRMLKHSDGSDYTEEVEKDLMKNLTLFIVDTQ